MDGKDARRPLKSRSTSWAVGIAGALARSGVSPNAISAISMVMALLGALAFVAAGEAWLPVWCSLLAAAVFIQLRLICNLMDGMVAIEGGKKSATGGIWNEVPDRFADTLLLVGAGIGCGAPWAGVAAARAAVMTAYVRELGADLDGQQDFCGPFAKPQRMAALTLASLIGIFADTELILSYSLWFIATGTFITLLRRLVRMARRLKQVETP